MLARNDYNDSKGIPSIFSDGSAAPPPSTLPPEYGGGYEAMRASLIHTLISANKNGEYSFQPNLDQLLIGEKEQATSLEEDSTLTGVSEIIDDAKSYLGLNASQVARFIGVARATLYNHKSQKIAPGDVSKYKELESVIREAKNINHLGISKGLKSVLISGKTLLEYLFDGSTSLAELTEIMSKVNSRLQDRRPSSLTSNEQQFKKLSGLTKTAG